MAMWRGRMWDEWDLHGLFAYTILGAVLVFWLWFTNPDAQWWVLGVVFLMFWLIWLVHSNGGGERGDLGHYLNLRQSNQCPPSSPAHSE